MTFYS